MATPSGLAPTELASLDERDLRRLALWHAQVAGDDDGRPFWGLAVQRLSLPDRLELATDGDLNDHWCEAERRRVVADAAYFVEGYGHVQPEQAGGAPVPFELWPMVEAAAERCLGARCQREVLERFVSDRIVVVLKARQLGLTWLALHFALWLMAFASDLPRAKVLALSKREDDAQKLLRRLRRIVRLLPPFLRPGEDPETRGSLSRFKLVGRGEALSLVSTPDTARSEQADLLLWDEAAFARHGQFEDTWTAAEPTLGDLGRAIIISTGNGAAETPGDGQGFARLFGQALGGGSDMAAVFLPDDVHPDRGKAWRKRKRGTYLSDLKFEQEHPLTVEHALAGQQGTKVYPLEHVAAAERLGRKWDRLLAAGKIEVEGSEDLAHGIDFGSHTVFLPIVEMEGGGLYVPPGEHHSFGVEVSEKAEEYLQGVEYLVEGLGARFRQARYDSAGVESMRTFLKVVALRKRWRDMHDMKRRGRREVLRYVPVPFNRYKTETVDYLRWLMKRTAEGETVAVIGISPKNVELLRQLRGLEFEDDLSAKLKKHDDHGPDALVAGAAPVAARNRDRGPMAEGDDDDEDQEEAA